MDAQILEVLRKYGLESLDDSELRKLPDMELFDLSVEIAGLAGTLPTDTKQWDDDDLRFAEAVKDAREACRVAGTQARSERASALRQSITSTSTPAPVTEPGASVTRVSARRRNPTQPQPRTNDMPLIASSGQRYGFDALVELTNDAAQMAARDRAFHRVARVEPVARDPRLGPDPHHNATLIASAIDARTRTLRASGGVCAPAPNLYQLPTYPTDGRPVRDSLVRFSATRGGVRIFDAPTLADVAGGLTDWTHDIDASPGQSTKNVLAPPCPTSTEYTVDAVVRAMTVGNFRQRFFAEDVMRLWSTLGAAHARFAETKILNTIITGSTLQIGTQIFGTARSVLATLDRAATGVRQRSRLGSDAPLELIAPTWLRDNMRADITRQAPGDDVLDVTNARINAMFGARGINPTWTQDWPSESWPVTPDAALAGWPSHANVLLFAPGTWLFLDAGELDFGIVRDATLNATNDMQMMSETFEQTCFNGLESLRIDLDICADGTSSLPHDVDPCGQGS